MPNLIGGIVLGYTWQSMINAVLANYGTTLVANGKYGLIGLILLMNWQMIGYMMIIYIAGLQNVPTELIEASKIDGATKWQTLRHVTIPMVMPIGLILLMNWQMIGYMMIIYIAGLQNVPTELIEASKIDGATKWQTLRHVTIPMVMPSITICLFLTLSNSFKLYDQNLALTNGAPMHKTEMLALNIVNSFYGRNNFEGVGQAKAVMFFIIVALIALTQLYYTRKREVEQ